MTDAIVGQGRLFTLKDTDAQYSTATFEDIVALAASEMDQPPARNPKDHWWAVFVDTPHPQARSIRWHRDNPGSRSTMFWVDIDEGDPTFDQVYAVAAEIAQGHEFLLYTSRSHGEIREDGTTKRKYRILFPQVSKIPPAAYKHFARALNDRVLALGLTPDRATEKAAQICYLPNAGPEYRYYHHRGPRLDVGGEHFHWWWFAAQKSFAAEELERERRVIRDETNRSPVAAFCRKHGAAEMLGLLGFETCNGVDWHWPGQTTKSFGTKVDDDDRGWVTASESVKGRIGRANGDAYDLFVRWTLEAGGTVEQAETYSRACLEEDDKRRFGAATTDHGYHLWQAMDWVDGRPHSERARLQVEEARRKEAEQARAIEQQAHDAEAKRWGGDWVSQVPIPVKPTALEWLAWHAPGVIGEAVRARAPKSARFSLVPHMLGALAALTHLGQGKFVSRRLQHITPVALMLFQVGDSGSGKGDGTAAFYELVNSVSEPNRVKAKKVKTFASGQSLTDYLTHHSGDVFMVQNEGGADRSAGKGDKNFESLIAVVTDAYTSFENGIEITHTKSDDKEAKFIEHPTVAALMSSTPGKLFASISNADGESGWLGRNLFIKLPSTRTNLEARPVTVPPEVIGVLDRINMVNPPLVNSGHPQVWDGKHGSFHLMQFSEEANAILNEFTHFCDDVNQDERRSLLERSVYARASEAVARLATVVALSDYRQGVPTITAEHATWSRMLVEQSLGFVTSKMETMTDEEATPASRIRDAVKRYFRRTEMSTEYRNGWGPAGYRKDVDGRTMIGASRLSQRIKDNCGVSSRQAREELQGLVEDEVLAEVQAVAGARVVKWFKLAE